jgi:hypothetical protein
LITSSFKHWAFYLWRTYLFIGFFSVADPGCLSQIMNPDFYPSRIPDLGSWIPDPITATKEEGGTVLFTPKIVTKLSKIWVWDP